MPNSQYGDGSGRLLLRRIIPLVGAMLASLVMLSAVASSASAEPVGLFIGGAKSEEVAKQPKFEAEKYTATIKGKSQSIFEFTGQYGVYKCNNVELFGSAASATAELPLTSFFSECIYKGFPPTLSMNGCSFKLHVLNAGPPYVGSYDIVCPAGQAIVVTAFAAGIKKCTLTIPAQTGLEGISFENTGVGSGRAILATFNLTGMKYSQLEGSGIGRCTSGEFTDGTYTGIQKFTATK